MEDRIKMMLPNLNEMQKRLYLASEALTYGRGGISEVIRITGFSRNTIKRGIEEIKKGVTFDGQVRKSGGGRKYVEEKYPNLEEKILKIIDGSTYGDPNRILSYTTESMRKIQKELEKESIYVGHVTVGKILDGLGYSKQANQKMLQVGEPHPDRNAQFEHTSLPAGRSTIQRQSI
jgi:hypothetical protein